jgi:hypothetical protein
MTSDFGSNSLLVLAAGMGSRYGGLKQVDPVGPNGETLMDYSIHDARVAGFSRVVFLIREEMQEVFDQQIASKYTNQIEVEYAYQRIDDLPQGYRLVVAREKPWGTGHAVWCAREVLAGRNFAVINADDFYGRETFSALIDSMNTFPKSSRANEVIKGAIVGYRLRETLSPHGSVSRGICQLDQAGFLQSVEEWTGIRSSNGKIFGQNSGGQEQSFSGDEVVSMNVWAFPANVFPALEDEMNQFLENCSDSARDEFYLPAAVDQWIRSGRADFRSNLATCQWMGVTYREDKPAVAEQVRNLIAAGLYPDPLF